MFHEIEHSQEWFDKDSTPSTFQQKYYTEGFYSILEEEYEDEFDVVRSIN